MLEIQTSSVRFSVLQKADALHGSAAIFGKAGLDTIQIETSWK